MTPAQRMLEAVMSGDETAVAILLESDCQLCNLSDRTENRSSVLHHAAGLGLITIAELLLTAGANVDKRSHDGSTALHQAAIAGHLQIVKRLVEAGADQKLVSNGGGRALEAARRHRHNDIICYLRDHPPE